MNLKPVKRMNTGLTVERRNSIKGRADTQINKVLKKAVSPTAVVRNKVIKSKTGVPSKTEESDDSIDSEDFFGETERMKRNVVGFMQNFRNANEGLIDKNNLIENEVDKFQENFEVVKNEVTEIFVESSKSRNDMLEMKKKLSDTMEKYNNINTKLYINESISIGKSLEKEIDKNHAKKKIQILKQEIENLKSLIDTNEATMRSIDSENDQLRNHSYQIKENLSFKKFTKEPSKLYPGCQSCSIS